MNAAMERAEVARRLVEMHAERATQGAYQDEDPAVQRPVDATLAVAQAVLALAEEIRAERESREMVKAEPAEESAEAALPADATVTQRCAAVAEHMRRYDLWDTVRDLHARAWGVELCIDGSDRRELGAIRWLTSAPFQRIQAMHLERDGSRSVHMRCYGELGGVQVQCLAIFRGRASEELIESLHLTGYYAERDQADVLAALRAIGGAE